MTPQPRWILRTDKTPKDRDVYDKTGNIRHMGNGKKIIFVESLFTDRKLGITKAGVKKRHIKDTTE